MTGKLLYQTLTSNYSGLNETDRQIERQTDRQRQTDRHTEADRQTDRQTDRQAESSVRCSQSVGFPRSMQLYTVTDGLFPSNMEQQVSSTYGIVFPHCVVRAPLGIRTDHMS